MSIEELMDFTLFQEMTKEEVQDAFKALRAREKTFQKGDIIFLSGDPTAEMGLVLSGSVTIENDDLFGNRTILSLIGRGELFAETYALLGTIPLLVNVCSNEDSDILFLRLDHEKAYRSFPWQHKFFRNLLLDSSRKNLLLSSRAFHTAPKTIRGRVMAYLDSMSKQSHSYEFDLPFNRQQMADYLNVDRTALSKELARMKEEHLLDYHRSHFRLLLTGKKE